MVPKTATENWYRKLVFLGTNSGTNFGPNSGPDFARILARVLAIPVFGTSFRYQFLASRIPDLVRVHKGNQRIRAILTSIRNQFSEKFVQNLGPKIQVFGTSFRYQFLVPVFGSRFVVI